MKSYKHLPLPKVVRIEPAGKCNLSCIHCPTGTVEMPRGIMDYDTFELIFNEIKQAISVKVIVLYHGGEPLLNKNFFNMVELIKKHRPDMFVKTVSNGNILTENTIDKIIKSNINMIEFSLDGLSINENNNVRVKCNGEKVLKSIKKLIEKRNLKKCKQRTKIYISSTQFLRNKEEVANIKNAKCPDYISNVIPLGYNGVDGYKINYAMVWPHMGNVQNKFIIYSDNKSTNNKINKCDMLDSTITVRWNGDVVPCCYDLTSKLIMGNVKNSMLIDIWNNNKYNVLRSSIANKKHISICKKCSVVNNKRYLIPKWESKSVTKNKNYEYQNV